MTTAINAMLNEGQPDDWRFRLTSHQREFAAFTLWVIVTFVQFRGDELLLYPLALYFAVRVWQNREKVLDLVTSTWPIMVFPFWSLTSVIWAVDPGTALKQTVYLLLTMMICYHVVLFLSARQIIYAALIATGFVGVLNILYGLSVGRMVPGLFPHKNMLGTNMIILWIVSLGTFFDTGSTRRVRTAALALAAVAIFLIFKSRSATAILLAVGCGTGVVIGAMVLQGSVLRLRRLAAVFLVAAVVLGISSNFIATYQGDPVEEVLNSVGKDRTLTGRTVLWDYAMAQISEAPWLGVGSGGFWRYDESPLVQRIYEEFYKWRGENFNFHNSFLEIAVHQGLVGLGLTLLACVWASAWNVRGAVGLAAMPNIIFLSISLAVLVRTMAEADFYRPFVLFHMLFWIGALAAVRETRARRSAQPGSPYGNARPNMIFRRRRDPADRHAGPVA